MGAVDLPIEWPVAPMLAKAAKTVPEQPGDGPPVWLYEPKWDGFRAIVFRDGDEVRLGSRGGKDLARYFPELVEAIRRELPERVVVDGEIVVPREIDGRTRLDCPSASIPPIHVCRCWRRRLRRCSSVSICSCIRAPIS